MSGNRQVEVVMINFTSPVSFVAGDILGLRQVIQCNINTGTILQTVVLFAKPFYKSAKAEWRLWLATDL